jgi:arylsulfatase A-like enzyme
LGVLRKHELIPQYLARYGYKTMATGKLFHQISANQEFFQESYVASGSYSVNRRLNGVPSLPKNFDWGPLDIVDDDETPDFDRVNWAIRQLGKEHDAPFFLAVGLVRPHLPWTVPRRYFEEFPLDEIELPPGFFEGDLEDLPRGGRREGIRGDHEKIVAAGKWKEAIRGYLASVLYADAAVGRLWDALQASEYKDDTIVILWGDHGWQFGEKERWRKFTLWSAGSQTTLIFSSPSQVIRGQVCKTPVDLMAVYPTIVELVGESPREDIDGASIVSLLNDCSVDWSVAALTTNGRNNHAVRYRNWSYIRHANRDEELYDRDRDPWEWHNLATDPDTVRIRGDFADMLPCWEFPIVGSIGCEAQGRN